MTAPDVPFTIHLSASGLWAASAVDRPCEMYLDHGWARPAFTEGHHRFPMYLQKRLWGQVRDNDTLIWLCGTCHNNVHGWLYMLMGEWGRFVAAEDMPLRARREAEYVHAWYQAELAAAA